MSKRKGYEGEQQQDAKKLKLANVNTQHSKDEQRKQEQKKQPMPKSVFTQIQNAPVPNSNTNEIPQIIDIDRLYLQDPIYCATYAKDIARCLLSTENLTQDYLMEFQRDINIKMRMILMDWIVEVADQYNLSPKALFLAKKIIDTMLGKVIFTRNQLQLLGVVAILIAAKFEDISSPTISELVYISDNSCTVKEIKELEVKVLDVLNYELTIPTEVDFLPRFISAACCHYKNTEEVQKITFLANYFSETTLLHYYFINFKPSTIAIVCVCLALATSGLTVWNDTIAYYSPIRCSDKPFTDCMSNLLKVLKTQNGGDNSVKKKYSQDAYLKVSCLPLPDGVPFFGIR